MPIASFVEHYCTISSSGSKGEETYRQNYHLSAGRLMVVECTVTATNAFSGTSNFLPLISVSPHLCCFFVQKFLMSPAVVPLPSLLPFITPSDLHLNLIKIHPSISTQPIILTKPTDKHNSKHPSGTFLIGSERKHPRQHRRHYIGRKYRNRNEDDNGESVAMETTTTTSVFSLKSTPCHQRCKEINNG